MPYELSNFAPDFFGDPYASHEKRRRPTDLCEALASMRERDWRALSRDICPKRPEIVDLELAYARALEVNTVSNLDSPVEVWLDEKGWHRVLVYDSKDES